jgi:hypothetical protein
VTASERGAKQKTMTLPIQRSAHGDLTPREPADRLAIRELIDAYAHCVDRRDVEECPMMYSGLVFDSDC